MTTILLIGGADTGRAPIAAALLRRLIKHNNLGWQASSAGVLGHDGDAAEVEARDTMAHLGLDISSHQARSLSDALLAEATLLVAIDSGILRVLRGRFPDAANRTVGLGELAGRQRDVPDPFRMQLGAWLTYARELETMLEAALPNLRDMLPADPADEPVAHVATLPAGRAEALAQIDQILQVTASMPGVIDWNAARTQIDSLLPQATQPADATDLAPAYAGLVRAALAMSAVPPSSAQITALSQAIAHLHAPITSDALTAFSARIATWAQLDAP